MHFEFSSQEIGASNLSEQRQLFAFSGLHKHQMAEVKIRAPQGGSNATCTKLCKYSPTAAKLNKYSPYKQRLPLEQGFTSCEILPLVFGVRGFVPTATFNHLTKLCGPKVTAKLSIPKQLLCRIMHIIFRSIVEIYKAWASLVPAAAN